MPSTLSLPISVVVSRRSRVCVAILVLRFVGCSPDCNGHCSRMFRAIAEPAPQPTLILRSTLPRGGADAPRRQIQYTDRQKRKAEHIEEGYEKRGVSKKEAERRAWATVNKEEGGGNKSGSGRGMTDARCRRARVDGSGDARRRDGRPRPARLRPGRRPRPASGAPRADPPRRPKAVSRPYGSFV